MMVKLAIPAGKSLYEDAPFDVRRRLNETFKRFKVANPSREIVGESLLRLERVQRKAKKLNCKNSIPEDNRTRALFDMLYYYKSLK